MQQNLPRYIFLNEKVSSDEEPYKIKLIEDELSGLIFSISGVKLTQSDLDETINIHVHYDIIDTSECLLYQEASLTPQELEELTKKTVCEIAHDILMQYTVLGK